MHRSIIGAEILPSLSEAIKTNFTKFLFIAFDVCLAPTVRFAPLRSSSFMRLSPFLALSSGGLSKRALQYNNKSRYYCQQKKCPKVRLNQSFIITHVHVFHLYPILHQKSLFFNTFPLYLDIFTYIIDFLLF